jgi:hypothetical protein
LWSLWIPRGTQILKCRGRWSCTHRPELGTLGHDQKERRWRRLTKNGKLLSKDLRSLGVSAKDSYKHWAMRRLSQVLVLALLSASTLLYQFLQPTIGGKGQFLKASCHEGGLDKAALKGILLESAAMNSWGSKVPTRPRK